LTEETRKVEKRNKMSLKMTHPNHADTQNKAVKDKLSKDKRFFAPEITFKSLFSSSSLAVSNNSILASLDEELVFLPLSNTSSSAQPEPLSFDSPVASFAATNSLVVVALTNLQIKVFSVNTSTAF
jgi:hypothetical protein